MNNTRVYGPDLAMDIEGWAMEKEIHLDDLKVMWLDELHADLDSHADSLKMWCEDNDFYDTDLNTFEDLQYNEIRGSLWEGGQQ